MPEENRKPGILRNLRVKRISLVDMGANYDQDTKDGAHIMLFKRAEPIAKEGPAIGSVHIDSPEWDASDMDDYEKADLTAESRRRLPDSAFLAVWTDAQGKKHRKLPVHDAGHLAAARGRIDQAQIPEDVKAAARRKLERLSSTTHTHKESTVAKIASFLKKVASAVRELDVAKRDLILKEAEAEAEAEMRKEAEAEGAVSPKPGGDGHEQAEAGHLQALQDLHKNLTHQIKAYGPGPHPDGHPVHAMKAHHAALTHAIKSMGGECDDMEAMGKEAEARLGSEAHKEAEAAVHHVTKRVVDLEKRNTELQTQLNVEIEKRLNSEMYEVLKGFKHIPLNIDMAVADNDVVRFRKMKQSDPAGYERTIALLKAADAQASVASHDFGTGRSGTAGSAWAQIEAKADALVQKSTNGLTREKALDLAMQQNPELVRQHRTESQ